MVIAFPTPAAGASTSDHAERTAALDTQTSCIVEAPAGSGKTGLLIQRYLKLLAAVEEPEQVLALTFTNKATAEMQERVMKALRSAMREQQQAAGAFEQLTHDLAAAALRQDGIRGWRLLDRPHRLNIRTIDSLCGRIARAVPLLSGEAGLAQPVDDPSQLYRRAAHAVLMRFGGDDTALNSAVETILLHRDGDLGFCERVLAEMLATREQWGSLIPLGRELTEEHLETITLPRLNQSLQRAVCNAMEELRNALDEDALHEFARIAERHAYGPGYNGDPNPLLVCAGLQAAPGYAPHELPHWKAIGKLVFKKDGWRLSFSKNNVGTEIDKKDAARLKSIIEDLPDEMKAAAFNLFQIVSGFEGVHYPAEQWTVTKALFRLLERALIELQLIFAAEEVCDFTGVALAARTALQDPAFNTAASPVANLQHLLVDEMQDTSASQYDLLERLTAGWDGGSQTVFLVGDPKQSIYLFRQARVDRFQACVEKKRLGDIKLVPLRLSTNFRSTRALVEQCNDAFTTMFPSAAPSDGDVEFHPASASDGTGEPGTLLWQVETVARGKDIMENRRARHAGIRREAKRAAAIVQSWQSHWRGKQPLRAAVLTRARTHVTEIAKTFAAKGIPFRAVELQSLAERQEVLDVVAITRALLHPADRVAWLALLRAPWCGLQLAHLHTLAAGDDSKHGKESLRPHLRSRLSLLPATDQSRVQRTLDVLDAALQHTGVEPLSTRVERTWRSLGGDLALDPTAQENVTQFFRVLDAMAVDGEAVTIAALDRRLERLFATPSTAANAVDIMTIHRAKGLEWDLVIVPGLHRLAGRNSFSALEWLELPTRGDDGTGDVLLAPMPAKGGEAGALLNFVRTRKRTRGYLELKRLFYVAATRARSGLHLFASPDISSEGKVNKNVNTLLAAAWPAAEPEFDALARSIENLSEEVEVESPLALAAAAEPFRLPMIQRLPDNLDPIALLHAAAAVPHLAASASPVPFTRPQGTFGARAVGNAIHAFTERLARAVEDRTSQGLSIHRTCAALLQEIPGWAAAIHNTLRSGGLPPAVVLRAGDTVQRALRGTLESEEGQWLLQPHPGAADESAWRSNLGAEDRSIRLDRCFFAGATPTAPGGDVFWIIDFKTGDHDAAGRDAYLQEERAKYEEQLHTYAAIRQATLPAGTPIMLALFYPLIGKLLFWPYAPAATPTPVAEANSKGQFSLFG